MHAIDLEHILITAEDGLLLPTFYFHGAKKNKVLAVNVHGAGSSSIVRSPKLNSVLAQAFITNNIDFLTFNNRGSGYMTKFATVSGKSFMGGMAFERIEDFKYDLNGVKAWARQHGYDRIILVGHSTGANKIALTVSGRADPFIAGVALLGGGDDISLQRQRYDTKLLHKVEDRLRQEGDSSELVPVELFPGEHPISWASLGELLTVGSKYDVFPFGRADEEPSKDHFSHVRNIKLPTLFIYGSDDFGTVIPVEKALKMLKNVLPASTVKTIEGADHSFADHEELLAAALVQWAREAVL